MFGLYDAIAAHRRGNRESSGLERQIASWGGNVLEHRRISRLVPSPFPGYRAYPNLHEFRVTHGLRRGRWFVRTSSDNYPEEWAWCDDDHYTTLPINHDYATVANNVHVVGWIEDSLLVGCVIIIGVGGCLAVALLLT